MRLVGYDVVSGVTPKTGRAPTNSQLSALSVEDGYLRIRAAAKDGRDTDLCSSTGSIPSMGGVRKEGWRKKRQSQLSWTHNNISFQMNNKWEHFDGVHGAGQWRKEWDVLTLRIHTATLHCSCSVCGSPCTREVARTGVVGGGWRA
jgi:hypothetical protein